MTLSKLICSTALAALLGLPLAAEADGFAQRRGEGERAGRADTNQDGRIDEAELAAITERLREHPKLFAWVDHDGDGSISRGELQRARALFHHRRGEGEHRGELKDRFDTDGDGHLSEAEREVAKERLADHRERHGHGPGEHRDELKERFDTDGDGRLSDEEKAAARERLAERRGDHGDHGQRREELKERFDSDGDGQLSEAEREAAKAAMQERLAERVERLRSEHPELFARIDRDGDGRLSVEELRQAKAHHRQHRGDGRRAD